MASRVPATRGRIVQDRVERGAVGADPGPNGSVPLALGAAGLTAAGRVDVQAADNVPGAGAEHRVGEPAALGEVLCMPLQVAEIVTQGHLVRPAAVREPRRRPDVVNAGRPGGVIGLVVLRPERDQPEFPGYEPVWYCEVCRNEQLVAHPAMLARVRPGSGCTTCGTHATPLPPAGTRTRTHGPDSIGSKADGSTLRAGRCRYRAARHDTGQAQPECARAALKAASMVTPTPRSSTWCDGNSPGPASSWC